MSGVVATAAPGVVAVVLALALSVGGLLLASLGAAPASAAPGLPARVAATGGCRAVGGGAVAGGGGPNRATVVVDTGSGTVWSACISFSGSISGIEALSRAEAVITDLDPVFDQYTGLGRAVCRLRGVGSDPPDCLGKSTSYWSYSHNGRVASVGAGAVTISDGDVEGWRYGTGGTPRSATAGTEATAAVPATTTTTRPATPTTRPATPTSTPKAGLTGSPGATTTAPSPGASTTAPGATTTTSTATGDVTTTVAEDVAVEGDSAQSDDSSEDAEGASAGGNTDDESAAAGASGATAGSSGGSGSTGGSSLPSVLGFVAALAAVGIAGVAVRRRRIHAHGAPASA